MPTAVLQRGIPGLAAEPVRVLHAHRWLIAAIAAHMVCGLAMVWAYDLPDKMPVDLYSTVIPTATLVFLGAFALLYPVYVMVFKTVKTEMNMGSSATRTSAPSSRSAVR